jgi:hypothetical protein
MLRHAAAALVFASAALASTPALAGASHRSAGHTGVGLGGGTTSGGISVKHFFSDTSAIQGVVGGWGGWNNSGLGLSADYLYEMPALAEIQDLTVGWNVGPGVGLGLYAPTDEVGIAVNGVVGIEFAFGPIPLDLVLEYRPTVNVAPRVDFDFINFTGHLRWFF